MSRYYRRRTGPRRRGLFFITTGLLLLIICGIYFKMEILPSTTHVKPDFRGIEKPIYMDGELQQKGAIGEQDSIRLPLTVVQKHIDSSIRYEQSSKTIIMATKDKLLHFKTDELTGKVNSKPFELRFAAEQVNKELYLPIAPLQELYGIQLQESQETGIITLYRAGDTIQHGEVASFSNQKRTVPLRTGPSIHEPIVQDVRQETSMNLLKQVDDWYQVQLDNGYVGYMRQADVVVNDKVQVQLKEQGSTTPAAPLSGPINLIWEAVYSKNPDVTKLGEMPGVNVVSPTWFSLLDEQGNLQSKADPTYVQWAHQNNKQVWALFSNSFEPDLTTKALATFETRFQMIQQILTYAQIYQVDGINIDFENIYTKDRDNFTQFIREITPMLREQGLIVSVDVTPKSNSEMWSKFLDREAIGSIVDYMFVMTYDEHWAASPKAGSVSSMPWVEESLRRIIEEDKVPPSKLVMGVPLFTRVWSEKTDSGKTKVSSKSVGMQSIRDIIKKQKVTSTYDEAAGQNYVEYTEDGMKKRIWIEDETSIKARVALSKQLKLAGTGAWARSFAVSDIWDALAP